VDLEVDLEGGLEVDLEVDLVGNHSRPTVEGVAVGNHSRPTVEGVAVGNHSRPTVEGVAVGNHSHPTVEMVGLGRHPLDLLAVGGGMLHRPITADLGPITDIIEAGFGPGFGCRFHSITGLGRRHNQITGTNPTTGTNNPTTGTNNPTTGTNNPTTGTNNPTTDTNLGHRHLSMAGTVSKGSARLSPCGVW
jgi:hypothetical protein